MRAKGSGEINRYLEDPALKRRLNLLRATKTGSASTEMSEGYIIKGWCEYFNTMPTGLVERAEKSPEAFKEGVVKRLGELRGKGRTSITAKTYFIVLRTFLKANGASFDLDTNLKTWVEKPIRPLTKEEIRKLRDVAGARMRAAIDCLKDSGLSPADLLELNVGDVRAQLENNEVPIVIEKVRRKTKIRFYTFLGPEAVRSLNAYLEERKNLKISVSDDTPLFVRRDKKGVRMKYDNLAWMFNQLKRRAGVNGDKNGRINLYSLRKYFTTRLRAAGINELFPKIWSGHSIGVEQSYFMPTLEEQKKQYLKHYEAIAVEEQKSIDVEKLRKEQLLDTARLLGIPIEKIEEIRRTLETRSFDDIVEALSSVKYESRFCGEEELPKLVSEGYEFVAQVNGRILVRKRV